MTRKFSTFALATLLCLAIKAAPAPDAPPKNASLVYVGTYTGTPAKSQGIYVFWLRTEGNEPSTNSTLNPLGVAAETPSPSFLTLDPRRHLLFCVNETETFNGKPGGGVSSFSIDPETGKLKLINQRSSMGTGPCQLTLDKTGKNVLVANYNSGSVAVLPVAADGTLGGATCVIQDSGTGPNAKRQEGPHAHCVTMSPDDKFAYVCDLGVDKVMIFKFDAEHGKLTPNDPPFLSLNPGMGPRHVVFHPNGKFAYVISELASTIAVCNFDDKSGKLDWWQELSTVNGGGHYDGPNTAAEIGIVPSGKFLYASNRGKDDVVQFAIDTDAGKLTWVAEQSSGGKTPRHFGIQPSGEHLVICNQNSDTVMVCRINAVTARLEPSGAPVPVPSPSCAVFLPPH